MYVCVYKNYYCTQYTQNNNFLNIHIGLILAVSWESLHFFLRYCTYGTRNRNFRYKHVYSLVRFYAEFTCMRAWRPVHCPMHVTSSAIRCTWSRAPAARYRRATINRVTCIVAFAALDILLSLFIIISVHYYVICILH